MEVLSICEDLSGNVVGVPAEGVVVCVPLRILVNVMGSAMINIKTNITLAIASEHLRSTLWYALTLILLSITPLEGGLNEYDGKWDRSWSYGWADQAECHDNLAQENKAQHGLTSHVMQDRIVWRAFLERKSWISLMCSFCTIVLKKAYSVNRHSRCLKIQISKVCAPLRFI